nr:MAG TPA: hypothetical protein [Bacteriophage sp.]
MNVRIQIIPEWYLNGDSTKTDVSASKSPTYPAQAGPEFNFKLQ